MNRLRLVAAAAGFALFGAGVASAAESWGLEGEEEAEVAGRVVDVLAELTGKHALANCGGGKRQLGIKTADGKLVMVAKDASPFGGATFDLLAYCGKDVEADGLFTEKYGIKYFVIQQIKAKGAKEFVEANKWLGHWAKANKLKEDDEKVEEWFRHDATVKAIIDRDGKLGVKE
ncbi:MAG TPA: hypothetical protein VJ924_00840 [Alphaproteobacteria bacterium]|nr:hypothetical protein [Alphaproteobacteria bacterium]